MGRPAVTICHWPCEAGATSDRMRHAWQHGLQGRPAGGDIAFVGSEAVVGEGIYAAAATDADATVIVEDASRGAGGRASADLAAMIWQSFPAVGALISTAIPAAGGVVFNSSAFDRVAEPVSESADPATATVWEIVRQGGTLRAVLMPGDSKTHVAIEPPELVPRSGSSGDKWRTRILESFDVDAVLGRITSRADATAVSAGLLLWHDLLDASHQQSQSIEGEGVRSGGDYWHAIMHRRERDYGNSKYWFRRVGRHPIFEPLATRVARNASDVSGVEKLAEKITPHGRWDPLAFVDACQEAESDSDGENAVFLRRMQADEMLLLLWQTCHDARGTG